MSKKINEEIKQTPAFILAKVSFQLNTRESARFASLFKNDEDFKNAVNSGSLIRKYISICREPKIRNCDFAENLDTRSKVVMAYEKQRTAFLKLKEMRHKDSVSVDKIILESETGNLAHRDLGSRCYFLQEVLRKI